MGMLSSLRWSLVTLAAVGIVATLLLGLQSLWSQDRVGDSASAAFIAKDVVADILPPPMYLIEMRLILSEAVEATIEPTEASAQLEKLAVDYEKRVAHWRANPPYGLEQHLLGSQHASASRFIEAARSQVVGPLVAGDRESARAALPGVHRDYLAHRAAVDETVRVAEAFASASLARVESVRATALHALLAVVGIAVLVVAALARAVLSSIERPLARCADAADRIASGDLTPIVGADLGRRDAIGRLQFALDEMRARLGTMVGTVRHNAESVAIASAQIASSNLDMSQRTETQAAVLQSTATTMAGIDKNVRRSAEHAVHADSLASTAAERVTRGGAVVGEAVTTMQEINQSSRKIAEIISVIDGIAFQTNILALNAAVEAARAGEQGRGFAVVATEVRNLAGRSATAAREISQLITASVGRVEIGSELVGRAGATMSEVVGAIRDVSQIVAEINTAAAEQRDGVHRITDTLEDMDRSTQQSAAMVEEIAGAAASLREQSETLVRAVAVFRIA
jgi:methyl-accepting chemotaxis protein-1 (serine sensor receptor)